MPAGLEKPVRLFGCAFFKISLYYSQTYRRTFMSIASEFKQFIMRGNVIDLAVGMVVGTAFSGIVKSLVDDVIMPPIGLLIGGVDFSNLFITLKDGAQAAPEGGYASLAAAQAAGAVTLNLGLFINSVISFLIIAAAIFAVIKALNSMKKAEAPVEEEALIPSEEVLLLREIRDSLNKKQSFEDLK